MGTSVQERLRCWSRCKEQDLENESDGEQLRELGLLYLRKRRLGGAFVTLYSYLKGQEREVGAGPFSQVIRIMEWVGLEVTCKRSSPPPPQARMASGCTGAGSGWALFHCKGGQALEEAAQGGWWSPHRCGTWGCGLMGTVVVGLGDLILSSDATRSEKVKMPGLVRSSWQGFLGQFPLSERQK